MRERKQALTEEQKKWLVTTGWKNNTLSQLAKALGNSDISYIARLLKDSGVEPVTQRDLIANKLLRAYGTETPIEIAAAAKEFECSAQLIKEIIADYSLKVAQKKSPLKPAKKQEFPQKQQQLSEEAFIALRSMRQTRSKQIREARAAYTYYTQTGSELLDDLRNIRTTKRESTLATNAIK